MPKAILLAALVLVAAPLHAQTPAPVAAPVYRIRLYEPWSIRLAPEVRATVPDSRADSLPLTNAEGRVLMVPRRDVISLDSLAAITPRNVMVKRGLKRGLIAGAVAGLVLGYLSYQEDGSSLGSSRGANAGIGAGIGAGLGGIIGGISGATRSGEQWQQLWSNEQSATPGSR